MSIKSCIYQCKKNHKTKQAVSWTDWFQQQQQIYVNVMKIFFVQTKSVINYTINDKISK